MIEKMGYEPGFQGMAVISLVVFFLVWLGLKTKPAAVASDAGRVAG
jgi:hypothetical protein